MDLTKLTNEQLSEYMDAGREECDRRLQVLAEAINGRPKGPGRPKNGVLKLRAADLEPADTDS